MKAKIILVIIIVLIFLFWRGVKQITAERKIDCTFHFGYAVCTTKTGKAADLPGFMDILKAGAKF